MPVRYEYRDNELAGGLGLGFQAGRARGAAIKAKSERESADSRSKIWDSLAKSLGLIGNELGEDRRNRRSTEALLERERIESEAQYDRSLLEQYGIANRSELQKAASIAGIDEQEFLSRRRDELAEEKIQNEMAKLGRKRGNSEATKRQLEKIDSNRAAVRTWEATGFITSEQAESVYQNLEKQWKSQFNRDWVEIDPPRTVQELRDAGLISEDGRGIYLPRADGSYNFTEFKQDTAKEAAEQKRADAQAKREEKQAERIAKVREKAIDMAAKVATDDNDTVDFKKLQELIPQYERLLNRQEDDVGLGMPEAAEPTGPGIGAMLRGGMYLATGGLIGGSSGPSKEEAQKRFDEIKAQYPDPSTAPREIVAEAKWLRERLR